MVREEPLAKEAIAARAANVDIKTLPGMLTVTAKRDDGLAVACGHQFDGIQPVMVFNIKGKKNLFVRLVKPSVTSLNSCDSFIIICEKKIIQWNGSKSSIIKKSKASEIANTIIKSKQMRCSYGNLPIINQISDEIDDAVFKMTKEDKNDVSTTKDEEVPDIMYEAAIAQLTSIFEVSVSESTEKEECDQKLVKITSPAQSLPSFADISSKKCYIFDFLTEVYVWIGRMSTPDLKEAALAYALNIYENPVGLGNCEKEKVAELSQKSSTFGFLKKSMRGMEIVRPTWSTFSRITERGEHEIFRSKFKNFPDLILEKPGTDASNKTRGVGVKSTLARSKNTHPLINIQSVFDSEISNPWILDGMILNRGSGGFDSESKFQFKVSTLGINVRILKNEDFEEVAPELINFLCSEECYLIEWRFKYAKCGIKKLKSVFLGNQKKDGDEDVTDNADTGRECSLCFYWHGRDCTIKQKGASAYITAAAVGDEAHQILVEQGSETPVFAHIFFGTLVQINGSDKNYDWSVNHCFWIHALDETEGILYEVPIHNETLRTQAAYVVTDFRDGILYAYLWIGSFHDNHSISRVIFENFQDRFKSKWPAIRNNLQKDSSRVPASVAVIPSEVIEFQEPEIFMKIFARTSRSDSLSTNQSISAKGKGTLKRMRSKNAERKALNTSGEPPISSLKACVFHCESLSKVEGQLLNNSIGINITSFDPEVKPRVNHFPMVQAHLYSLSQPALVFLEDSQNNYYLWHGWQIPEKQTVSKEAAQDNSNKSMMQNHMFLNKLQVAERAIRVHAEMNNKTLADVICVFAGMEPKVFQQVFPYWNVDEQITKFQVESGFNFGRINTFEDEIEHLFMGVFPLKVLQRRPLPENVDPTKIEMYLSDEEFTEVFKMSKDEFLGLSQWKRNEMRKQNMLF